MNMAHFDGKSLENAVDKTVRDLVRLQKVNGSSYINLPLLYPDGSSVTIKIDQVNKGLRVSDDGFAFRDAEDVDAVRSFGQNKKGIAEEFGVEFGGKCIFLNTSADGLFEAVCDVATASWQIAARVYSRLPDEDDVELECEVGARLKAIFGDERVKENENLSGSSSVDWPISALVSFDDHKTVFQVVGSNAASVNRTATAFRDLSLLHRPPKLVAVVNNLEELGPRASLISQSSAKILERGQKDEIWKEVA